MPAPSFTLRIVKNGKGNRILFRPLSFFRQVKAGMLFLICAGLFFFVFQYIAGLAVKGLADRFQRGQPNGFYFSCF